MRPLGDITWQKTNARVWVHKEFSNMPCQIIKLKLKNVRANVFNFV